MSKKLKLSVNPNIFNKTPQNPNVDWNTGFNPEELTLEELYKVINYGFSFSYQFKSGIRKSDNFICTDVIAVDMDGDRTIKETLNDEIVKKYGSLFYTTSSHTPDVHRFRIIFVLPRTLTDVTELKQSMTSLSRRLGGDMSVVDGGRLFFGSHNSNPTILGKNISDKYLDELIEDGKVTVNSESKSYQGKTTNRSKLILDMNMKVVSNGDNTLVLKDINTKTTIHCPFHNDTKPSGFVSFTRQGYMYLHCSKCKLTWYEKFPNDNYNFNDFEDTIVKYKNQDFRDKSNKDELIGLDKFLRFTDDNPVLIDKKNIQISNEKYMSLEDVNDGLTIIKSPKGSGKTTFLRKVIYDQINLYESFEQYEEDTWGKGEVRITSNVKVILLGHRQSLIGDLCKKLGLNNYLNDSKFKKSEIDSRKNRYGVCIDSLWKVKEYLYDIVVIDEVEQVLSHFLSGTIGNNGISLFNTFSNLVSKSSKIIVLDSDISWITFNTMTSIINQNNDHILKLNVYINQFKPTNRSINIFPSDKQLIGHIRDYVIKGKRIFITSNSKTKVKNIKNTLNKLSNDLGIDIPLLLITSENSRTDMIQEFIKDIKTKILDYQVILSSPSLGTGIDITFDNDDQHIDCVYGLFENQINSHFEIDQQLSRVRHPKEVNVWVSPRRFNFETEFDVITEDHLKDSLKDVIENQFGISINSIEYDVSPFYVMSSMIISYQRHSKNNLKNNFLKYKYDQGWDINDINKDKGLTKTGRELYLEGKEISLTENITNILDSGIFNEYQYVRFRDRVSVLNLPTPNYLWYYFYRTSIELFYRTKVTDDLIRLDDNGRLRGRIRRFEVITDPLYSHIIETNTLDPRENIKDQVLNVKTIKQFHMGMKLLHELLSTTPLFNGVFNTNISIETMDLARFTDMSLEYKSFTETQLDISTRKDITKKPVQHLNQLLNIVGLNLDKPTTKKINGKKHYLYKIDTDSFNMINNLSKRRKSDTTGWDYINSMYGFKNTFYEDEWLSPSKSDGSIGSHSPYENPHDWIKPFLDIEKG